MLTMKQVDDRLKRLAGRYGKVNEDVQEMGVAIIAHANDTGDCDRARKLVRCLNLGDRALLIRWFGECSPINVSMGKTVKDDTVSLRKEGKRHYMPFDIERAKANKWYENPFKVALPDAYETIEDYYTALERLFERITRNAKEDAKKRIDPAQVATVEALRAHMRDAFIAFKEEHPVVANPEGGAAPNDAATDDVATATALAANAA